MKLPIAILLSALLLLAVLFLPGCTVKPMIRSGETIVSLGGSIFTKTAGETSGYSGPLGTLSYSTATNDETIIPAKVANYYGIKAAINGATSMMRTTESTKRILGSQSVQKEAIQSAEKVESLRILNPVEVPAP